MTRKIRFYNRDGSWYADLPDYIESGGTEADCLMVDGADTWLDMLAKGRDNIFIDVSLDPLDECLKLLRGDDNLPEQGGTYIVERYNDELIQHPLWLCGVAHWLFGHFPHVIYYKLK